MRISVIIPCYNHGRYLATALQSVRDQKYPDTEIIVVNDGSTDDTAEQAKKFPEIIYVYQPNAGLSAARNKGVEYSTGEFLVFLDADDWLVPGAFNKNLSVLKAHPDAAFVSGGHIKINNKGEHIDKVSIEVNDDHYQHLLEGNYIGMHATVMYRRFIFGHFRYDISLRACEDYDIYLKIARRFPVQHHTEIIACYLIHGNNMSADTDMMLEYVMKVLDRQTPVITNQKEMILLARGRRIWTDYYKKSYPSENRTFSMRKKLKKMTPVFLQRALFKAGVIKKFVPSPGHVRLGDLNRTTPFSTDFGFDRGGPVDRYYIEKFLGKNRTLIKGRALEIGDNEYTLRYSNGKHESSDILHINADNKKATIIGDLSDAPHIADNSFDVIILTQTLHLIYDFKAAIRTCFRILKPGGCLLMTVPGITHIDQDQWKSNWLWAFTGTVISRILEESFPEENVHVETYGNVLAASAFLYGLGLPELKTEKLDHHDPHYQVIIAAKAVKPYLN